MYNSPFSFTRALVTFGAALAASALSSQAQTVNASASGWYSFTPEDESANTFTGAYIAGYRSDMGTFYRDFASFQIPTLSGPILTATLRYYNPKQSDVSTAPGTVFNGYSGSSSSTFSVYALTGISMSTLTSGGSDYFSLVPSGGLVGSTTVDATSNGTWVTVNLNPTAISLIQGASGGEFSFAGDLDSQADFIFGNTFTYGQYTYRAPQLVLTQRQVEPPVRPVPEPSTYGLLGAAGLLGIAAYRRRSARKAS